eukprot:scaffold219516_cov31-Tisochrysis_lutea.AAC.2
MHAIGTPGYSARASASASAAGLFASKAPSWNTLGVSLVAPPEPEKFGSTAGGKKEGAAEVARPASHAVYEEEPACLGRSGAEPEVASVPVVKGAGHGGSS